MAPPRDLGDEHGTGVATVGMSPTTTTLRFAMTPFRTATLLVATATITACGPAVRVIGEVNGDTMPAVVSAAYAPFDDEENDRVGLFVMLTTMPDACAFATDLTQATNDLGTAATRNDAERAFDDLTDAIVVNDAIGEWGISLEVFADREDDLRDDADIDVDADDDERSGASVIFFEDEPEFDLDEGTFEPNTDHYGAEDGNIVWDLDDDRRHVDFEATLELRELVDNAFGDRAGEVTISGRATRCASWEDVITDD
jgi:hypothetical protein